MSDRAWGSASRVSGARKLSARGGLRPVLEDLEERVVLSAALAALPNVTVPATLGYQLPLDGSASGATSETYTATSSNPNIKVTSASGEFLTLSISHTAANSSDITFSGNITFQLFQDLTPNTVSQIENFVTTGLYTASSFSRIASGFPDSTSFITQGGSPASGTTPSPFPDEFNQQLAFTGNYQVAMANAGPETNGSQFFFTDSLSNPTAQPTFLNFGFTIFGQVVSGQNLIDDMTKVDLGTAGSTAPVNPITINTATLSTTNPNGVLHIDATGAVPGETSTVTVTATDPTDNTTAKQSFTVTTVADPQAPEKPFVPTILPVSGNIVTGLSQTVAENQDAIFQIPVVSPTPNDPLTYEVGASVTPASFSNTGTFTPAVFTPISTTDGTATVNQSTGVVTVVPATGFTGTISMVEGVADNSNSTRTPDPTPSYHNITVTVTSATTPVQLIPIAIPLSGSTQINTPVTFSLQSQNPNSGSTQTLSYTITSTPGHGTLTGFNPATGQLTYTPEPNFTGADKFQYTVTSTGGGQATLTSLPVTVTVNVLNKSTGAVRVIGNVLVVTPLPAPKGTTNTIDVTQIGAATSSTATLQVTVNGVVDITQPPVADIDRIVVFGGKANDDITIDPSVTVPNVTLDGGHGGVNVLQAGSTTTVEHGWFGHTTLIGGTGPNELIGRAGLVKFKPTATTTEIFAGVPKPRTYHGQVRPPGGTFYKFVDGHIVKIPTPAKRATVLGG